MWVPNWFLGIGCTAGCAWYNWLLWFVPGLAVGPLLGLALVWLHWRVLPAADSSGGIGEVAEMILSNGVSFAAVTLIAGLGMAVVRSLPWLTFPHVESLWPVTLLWGLGGAILGAMLAVGWYITLPTSGWFITWPVGSRPTVTLGGLWWVLLGRRLPGQTKEERNEQVDPGASVRHSGPDRVPGGPSPDHPPR
jgi:hypothetical protein